jgi:hypothetical protein
MKIRTMKNVSYIFAGLSLVIAATFVSCKQEGCTDPLAINSFNDVKDNQDMCSYSTTRMAGTYEYAYDTLLEQANVFSYSISEMKVEGQFDDDVDFLLFHVDWKTKKIVMPDTLLKTGRTCTGTIADKDNFSCTLTVDEPGTIDDTTYKYSFTRIL